MAKAKTEMEFFSSSSLKAINGDEVLVCEKVLNCRNKWRKLRKDEKKNAVKTATMKTQQSEKWNETNEMMFAHETGEWTKIVASKSNTLVVNKIEIHLNAKLEFIRGRFRFGQRAIFRCFLHSLFHCIFYSQKSLLFFSSALFILSLDFATKSLALTWCDDNSRVFSRSERPRWKFAGHCGRFMCGCETCSVASIGFVFYCARAIQCPLYFPCLFFLLFFISFMLIFRSFNFVMCRSLSLSLPKETSLVKVRFDSVWFWTLPN